MIGSYLAKYLTTSLDETHCSCCNVPGILHYAEMGDVAALIAPRPVIYVNGQRDPSSSAAARESFATVSHMYRFLGAPRRAKLIEPVDMVYYFDNELAIGWFRQWLAQKRPN